MTSSAFERQALAGSAQHVVVVEVVRILQAQLVDGISCGEKTS
jgi:hypothetical protein